MKGISKIEPNYFPSDSKERKEREWIYGYACLCVDVLIISFRLLKFKRRKDKYKSYSRYLEILKNNMFDGT
jgi:hypothetical protein